MKKLLLFVSVLTLGLTSCNKDDDSSSAALEGKWEYFQEGTIVSGQEVLAPYDHTAGCEKDYAVITAAAVTNHQFYMEGNPEVCTEDTYTIPFTRNGNMLTVTEEGETYTAEILQLDASTLKMKSTITFGGETFVDLTVYKRIN